MKKKEMKCVTQLRHNEYYDMQGTFDNLYEQAKQGTIFESLMDIILSEENIMLA